MARRARSWTGRCPLVLLVLTLILVPAAGCSSGTSARTGSIPSSETTAGESAAPESLRLTQADDGGTFAVKASGTIDIALEANPSTGYFWELNDPDPEASLIEQVGEPTFVPDDPGAVGAAGIMTFTFRAVDKGEMIIELIYLPPGGDQTPAKTFHIDLTIK